VKIHALVRLELAARGEGRQLEVDALTGVIIFATIGAPALLLLLVLLVLGVDNLDGEGAFCAGVVDFNPGSLARGGHGWGGSFGAWPGGEG